MLPHPGAPSSRPIHRQSHPTWQLPPTSGQEERGGPHHHSRLRHRASRGRKLASDAEVQQRQLLDLALLQEEVAGLSIANFTPVEKPTIFADWGMFGGAQARRTQCSKRSL